MSTRHGCRDAARIAAALLVASAMLVLVAAPPAHAVMGGGQAPFAAWPWQVAILDPYYDDSYEAQFCGGTLIAPNVVLTAAHCLYDSDGQELDTGDIEVLSGTSILGAGFGDRSPVVGGYVADGDHSVVDDAHDLAVLWVQHTSPFAGPLPPATVADASAFAVGSRIGIAGWGANRRLHSRLGFPRKLKQYTGTLRAKARGFLWIRSVTASACAGDSGSPAVGHTASGAPVLVGVVDGGRWNCPIGKPVMFVNVAAQQAFIQEAFAKGPHALDSGRPLAPGHAAATA